MATSAYIRGLRERIGTRRLLLPSATGIVHDGAGRILLVRQREGAVWSTPGGAIEPDESPADAVVREVWEETGLVVAPERVLAVHGGPEFVVRYASGDEAQYVTIVFGCVVVGGALRADGVETEAVRFVGPNDVGTLALPSWLPPLLPEFFAPPATAAFRPPSWRPPAR